MQKFTFVVALLVIYLQWGPTIILTSQFYYQCEFVNHKDFLLSDYDFDFYMMKPRYAISCVEPVIKDGHEESGVKPVVEPGEGREGSLEQK